MAGISKAEREALAEVKSKFDAVELDEQRMEVVETIRKGFAKLAVELHRALPEGRNKSIAFTNLEDASMRAIRALSHDGGQPAGAPAAEATVDESTPAEVVEDAPKVSKRTRAAAPGASKPRSRRAKETVDA